ncbi:uncharacterized protein LOC110855192 [Folsomia candida]|uniref:uncharacterized protein LOC110855192 n=1 Tax=Folsomia candida TaxID=158441 RepID=UPI001604A1F3|nr:uncharacterized protein LOC110855192 [Folsomia candida]
MFPFKVIFLLALVTFLTRISDALPPEPVGPYYGFPYKPSVAKNLIIPSTSYGKCEAGKSYTISSIEDLKKHEAELQCVFAIGLTPSKVPVGPLPGGLLLFLNSRLAPVNPTLVGLLWHGYFAFKADCTKNSAQVVVGFHNVLNNRAIVPGLFTVGRLQGNFAPGEYEDGKPSLLIDFTQDLNKMCPEYAEFVTKNKDSLPTSVKGLTNFYPANQLLDAWRLVGINAKDGGKILLGKIYVRDIFRSDKQLATAAFVYMLSYDEGLNPEYRGETVTLLGSDFDFMFPGGVDLIVKLLPLDNFLSRPIATLTNLGLEARTFLVNIWQGILEFIQNIGSSRANSRKLRQYFQDVEGAKRNTRIWNNSSEI